MAKKIIAAVAVLLAAVLAVTAFVLSPKAIEIDFDTVVGEMLPVHNIGRMSDYEIGSEMNAYYTEANMTSCRTHDINVTDIHRIFPDFSRDVNDETAYDFTESDKVLAAIVDAGMEPFFRFGISWSDPEKSREHLQPPADFQKWAEICEHIILHYNEGWADGYNYNIEYWEIYNEPDCQPDPTVNNFWQGTPEEFYRLYDVTAKYLKSRFPELKIGGYGSCGFYALTKTNAVNTGSSSQNQYFITFFEDFLSYIKENNTPMDFFTWHSYTTTWKNQQYIGYVREKLADAGYADAEIIVDEWNFNPMENDLIDRRYGANQTSMLIMFQNEGLDMAHYYCANYWPESVHAGMFLRDKSPSSAYYGFLAFGQMYELGSQALIKNKSLPTDLYALAATGENGKALLVSNISEKYDRALKLKTGEYSVDKCRTVNEECEWVEISLPEKIESGQMLYITFTK